MSTASIKAGDFVRRVGRPGDRAVVVYAGEVFGNPEIVIAFGRAQSRRIPIDDFNNGGGWEKCDPPAPPAPHPTHKPAKPVTSSK